MLDTIFYHPISWCVRPGPSSSSGKGNRASGVHRGVFGPIVLALQIQKEPLVYADVVASAFPMSWVFGRTGCTIAHDHPGMLSDAWFAVQYPGGGRFDLGLYEMLLTIHWPSRFSSS